MRIENIILEGSIMSFSGDEEAMTLLAKEGMKYLLLKAAYNSTDDALFEWLQLGRSKVFADKIIQHAHDNYHIDVWADIADNLAEDEIAVIIEDCITFEEALQTIAKNMQQ